MPTWTINQIIYETASHHRQPRNPSSEQTFSSASGSYSGSWGVSNLYLPPPPNTVFLFWSVNDGAGNGWISTLATLRSATGYGNGLTITAWYFPVPIIVSIGGSGIIDDAFSVQLGDFIDDTFVTVTSDPSLTNGANVDGVIPTAENETLQAYTHVVSTTEPFAEWVSTDAGTAVGDTLNVPAGANGIAIAIYQYQPSSYRDAAFENVGPGVMRDGGSGPGEVGPHEPPWNELSPKLARASAVVAASRGMGQEGSGIRQLAAKWVLKSIRSAQPAIEGMAEEGE